MATFIAGQTTPPNMPNADPSAGISRVVVGAILGAEIDDDEYDKKSATAILTMLPEICKIHPQLAKSLNDIYIEVTTNADSFMPKMYPNILSKLEAIKSNQS